MIVDVVVPTIGRPSLGALLGSLAACAGTPPRRVIVVDDRPHADAPLPIPHRLAGRTDVVATGGCGAAAARNVGWRHAGAPWVAFLDDDVVVPQDWLDQLEADLAACGHDVGASQGRITVPLPSDRRPTDWERNVAGLERARWATADMAYRRAVLAAVGGFDERFRRAYREDTDLGLRVTAAGWRILRGQRRVIHPVRPAMASVSVRAQTGNADDVLMAALHGRGWRQAGGVGRGRRPVHLATVAAAATAAAAALAGRRSTAWVAGGTWAALCADFAWRRIAPGPRDRREVITMAWTSAVLPFAATGQWLYGISRLPRLLRRPGPSPQLPGAVLFDRDDTLVRDVPYNGDPQRVEPLPGARAALDRLRRLGVPVGVVSNQSGVARGLLAEHDVAAVNARVEQLLGPFDTWQVCTHGPDDGCACRKPAPGLIHRAAAHLGIDPRRCVLIGDIGADVEAAAAAGARGILVPTGRTLRAEVDAAPEVVDDLAGAVNRALEPVPDRAAPRRPRRPLSTRVVA